MYPSIKLKSGREVSASYHHPWVFSGAIDVLPQALLSGDLVRVEAHDGRILGVGSYSSQSMIAVRLWDFTDVEITPAWLKLQLEQAYARRLQAGFGPTTPTTAYRVVFGEVDGLPGLVLDRYADVWVMQISTAAMERFRPTLIDVIRELFAPRAIVERSDIGVRQE